MVCPDETGIDLGPAGSVQDSDVINPGEIGYVNYTFQATQDPDTIPDGSVACQAQLLPGGGDAFVILDTRNFGCDFDESNETDDPPVIEDPPSAANATPPCGCWDFYCYDLDPDQSRWDTVCWVVPFVIGVICLTICILGMVVFTVTKYYANKRQRASKEYINTRIKKARDKIKNPETETLTGSVETAQ